MTKKTTSIVRKNNPHPKISTHSLSDLKSAKREWSKRLLHYPSMPASRALTCAVTPDPRRNLLGVGIGEKIADGQHTGVLAVKFLVRAKYRQDHIDSGHLLPKSIDGLPVDVEEVGLLRPFAAAFAFPNYPAVDPRSRIRPAQPGCSIGFADPKNQFKMAGTFGALVKDDNGTYLLSNNHVLADEGQLAVGAPIFQPGLLDNGDANTDQIAQLTRSIPFQAVGLNEVDCALAQVTNPNNVSNAILQIGPPQGVVDAQIDMTVQKFGRTTGYTAGQVTSIDTDVTVQYETGNFVFQGQMLIVGLQGEPFSNAGDSGSLIVERGSNAATGLLFAGSPSHTIANHIGSVLSALNVTLA